MPNRLESRYQAIFNTAKDGIIVIDDAGIICSFNPAAERIFGYQSAEIIGQNLCLIMPQNDYRATRLDQEVIGVRKDGINLPLELSIAERTEDSARYFTIIVRDITERRNWLIALQQINLQLEQRIAERTSELAEANALLRKQIDVIIRADTIMEQAQRMEAVGQLTGGIAHDFNNLLTVIFGSLDRLTLCVAKEDKTTQTIIDMAQQAAERGAQLVNQLLSFARQQMLRPEATDLFKLVNGFLILIEHAVGERVKVQLVQKQTSWPVLVDTAQFETSLINLAMNARDAMPNGGRLVISIENVVLGLGHPELQPGDYVMVAVTDSGSGMTETVMAHAFEPFFTTKPLGKGTGLGLSQVYGFVRQSGGSVVIESTLGERTTIRLYVPRL